MAERETPKAAKDGLPNVGEILKRFRTRRGESLRDVAQGTGLSSSFLSMVERGKCDISLGRLALIAEHFDHDIGSLLGYSARGAKPQFVVGDDRIMVDRGQGVEYEVLRIPSTEMEVILARFEPHAGFRDELTHEGIDIAVVISGEVVVTVNDVDYPMREGDCAVWSAAYRHRLRNDSAAPATIVAVVTESVY